MGSSSYHFEFLLKGVQVQVWCQYVMLCQICVCVFMMHSMQYASHVKRTCMIPVRIYNDEVSARALLKSNRLIDTKFNSTQTCTAPHCVLYHTQYTIPNPKPFTVIIHVQVHQYIIHVLVRIILHTFYSNPQIHNQYKHRSQQT